MPLPEAIAGRDVTWIAGPGRLNELLSKAVANTDHARLVVDSHLAVAVLVHELHSLTVCCERRRFERLRAFFARGDSVLGTRRGPVVASDSAARVLAVAGALLRGSPDGLAAEERGQFEAVVRGGKQPLAFAGAGAVVDWSQHAAAGIWSDPAEAELGALWRCSRYLSVWFEIADADSAVRLLEVLTQAELSAKDFSGGLLGTVRGAEHGRVRIDTWCPDIAAMLDLPEGLAPVARISRMAQRCGGFEAVVHLRARVLDLLHVLSKAPPEDAAWGLDAALWTERRHRAGAYLYVGAREADMTRVPLVRVDGGGLPKVVVEPDEGMWRRLHQIGSDLRQTAALAGCDADGVTTHWLAQECLALLDPKSTRAAAEARGARLLEKLIAEARFGETPGRTMVLEGDAVRVRRTPLHVVSIPWRTPEGVSSALAVSVGVESVTPVAPVMNGRIR